jgi:hypothetical protein
VTLVTFVGGVFVRLSGERRLPSLDRLGSLLWAVSAVMFATTQSVSWGEIVGLDAGPAAAVISVTTLLYAGTLWAFGRGALLQLVCLGIAIGATEAALLVLPNGEVGISWVGVVVCATGIAWCLFTWAGLLRPTGFAWLCGGVAILLGAEAFNQTSHWLPIVVGLLTAVMLIGSGIVLRRAEPVVSGGIGLSIYLPQLALVCFGNSIGLALALLIAGFVVIAGSSAFVFWRIRS